MKKLILIFTIMASLACELVSVRAQGTVNKNAGWASEWTKNTSPEEAGSLDFRVKYVRAMNRERYKEAVEVALQWTKAQPGYYAAWEALSAASMGAKQWRQSEQAASRLLGFSNAPLKSRWATLSNRATCRLRLKNYADAANDYREALRIRLDSQDLNSLAWILATCPDGKVLNGRESLTLALRAVKADPSAAFIDTLAAAYAETGDFKNAIVWQEKAVRLAAKANKKAIVQRLKLYQNHQPYRDAN